MPFFNLDPETVMPWDIIGCIMFPDDEEMALLATVYDLIQLRAGNLRGFKKIFNDSPNELENAIDNVWDGFGKELNRYGGLDVLGKLLSRSDFHKEQRRAIIEGVIAGKILRTAIQIRACTKNVTRKITFALVEEEINRAEAESGAIYYQGEHIAIKRSEKRLNDCWRNRSCVAHWWEALGAMWANDDPIKANPYFMDNVPVLAAIAKGYLSTGSMIMIRDQNGKRQPFINPEQAWQLGNLRGDYHSARVSIEIPLLANWAKEMLQ